MDNLIVLMQMFWDSLINECDPLWVHTFDDINDSIYKLVIFLTLSLIV